MIIYAGPTMLIRLLIPVRTGARWAAALRESNDVQIVSTALAVRECRADAVLAGLEQGIRAEDVLAGLDELVDPAGGLVLLVALDAAETERLSLDVVRGEGLHAAHARHLAGAELCFRDLAEPGEKLGFGADDGLQAAVARARGWQVL